MTAPIAQIVTAHHSSSPILAPGVNELVGIMQRVHGHSLRALLERRAELSAAVRAGAALTIPAETSAIRAAAWTVSPAPQDLVDRRVEITGPADRKMMISALNSGAQVFMADLEDSLSPTWAKILDAHENLRDAAAGTLAFRRPDGRVDRPNVAHATLAIRPRGLHMSESHMRVDGQPVAAAMFDTCLAAHHCAQHLNVRNSGLYLYLAKLESYHEAEWWDAVLADLERRLDLPAASIKVTVLIETITAAMQMDEIIYALRERLTGLNAGRWDYIFSIIKRLGHDAHHILPDRDQVTMASPFMAAYAERLVATCHRRGAYAIGGMAAFVPNRRRPEATADAISRVRADKEREARLGYDGTWVAHPDLVPVARDVFTAALGGNCHQMGFRPTHEPTPDALLDTTSLGCAVSERGVAANIDVSLRYLEAWLGGTGAAAINDLMEDAATVEISRSQLWQWMHHRVLLPSGQEITKGYVADCIDAIVSELDDGLNSDRLQVAADLLREVVFAPELPEFLTVTAQHHLS